MTLVYPVQWGVAIRRTQLTPFASPMFALSPLFFRFAEISFSHFAEEEENRQKAELYAAHREVFVKRTKTRAVMYSSCVALVSRAHTSI